MLSDFDIFKNKLDIVAPQGVKSLAAVGSIYGENYKKIDIGSYRNGNMKKLLKDKPSLFEEYALKDSEITLKHACQMEEVFLTVDKIGIPLTLSSLGKLYVIKEWRKQNYLGYQVRKDIMIARGTLLTRYLTNYIEDKANDRS
ncbi:hypothetical protein GGS23DRAFT_608421 [Durotheca rogersii]|uniref:uncharacterized protein n=1 Tax=Durotheca rogersii TaxID=419775 RepID=UPI0022211C9E|nr:uncharacterized protein GGS23DRAFT_608421 [Durotheca rogersii]KAI5850809.1 hypothetical protein GGS23DRAFT_608421 [Durotheca rogersii]